MILFDDVVQVFALPQLATWSDRALFLQFCYRHRVSPVLVNVDHSWHAVPWIRQRPAKEALRCGCISPGGQQKIDGLASRINRSIEEPFLSFNLNVGLIQAPTLTGWLEMTPAALVQFRPVDLDPAPNTTRADGQTSFRRHLRHLRHRERITQIPPYAPHDDVARIVSPVEGIVRGDWHVPNLPDRHPRFSQWNPELSFRGRSWEFRRRGAISNPSGVTV